MRIAYVVTQVTVLAVYYYVGQQVRVLLRPDGTRLFTRRLQIKKKNDLTVLKYGACSLYVLAWKDEVLSVICPVTCS